MHPISILAFSAAAAIAQPAIDPGAVFLEAWRVTRSAFYDPAMHGVDWEAVRDELMPRAQSAPDAAALSAVINDALSRLHASHTAHYTAARREYYELLDVFWPDGIPERTGSTIHAGPVEYVGIGLAAAEIDGRIFAADVYEGGPAAEAGILVGDELIGVEDGPWSDVAPFIGREGLATEVSIRRARSEQPRALSVVPRKILPHELFLESMDAGVRMIEAGAAKVGYIHVRSYANPAYHEKLKEHLSRDLAEADALVLDLRGGWGGASPEYMDIFNPVAPSLTYTNRDGTSRTIDPTWRKPVAVLINAGSRSGKEVLAYAMRKHHTAILVGERTAGAVLGGTVRPLSDGSVLYIAVTDVAVDGERLEGLGVSPDVEVSRPIPFCAGADPQLDAAVAALAEQVRRP